MKDFSLEDFRRRWKRTPKERKQHMLFTFILIVVSVIVAIIPLIAQTIRQQNSPEDDQTVRKLRQITAGAESYEDVILCLEREKIDLQGLVPSDAGLCYVWDSGTKTVSLRTQEALPALTPSLCFFDYFTEETCLCGSADGIDYYVIGFPLTVCADLRSVYSGRYEPEKEPIFLSEGIYLDFVRIVYGDTLFVNQVSFSGFSFYRAGEPATRDSALQAKTVIFGSLDAENLDASYADISLGLAAEYCGNAETIVLSEKTVSIDAKLAQCSPHLKEFVCDGNARYAVMNGALVDQSNMRLLAYPAAREESEAVVSESIRSVEEGAFRNAQIESLTLPFVGQSRGASGGSMGLFGYIFGVSDVGVGQQIGNSVLTFAIPLSLHTVVLTDEVKISKGAFSGCPLRSIVLNEGISEIGDDAFNGCRFLSELIIPDSVEKMSLSADQVLPSLERLSCPSKLHLEYVEEGFFALTDGTRTTYTKI